LTEDLDKDLMLDMFIFETLELVEQLEQLILDGEKVNGLESSIDEIFRIMHTIKGSASMMLFNNIASVAHSIEDIFYCLREEKPRDVDFSKLTDIVLESIDFIKGEVTKIQSGNTSDDDAPELIETIKTFMSSLKISHREELCEDHLKQTDAHKGNQYQAIIFFEDDCEMENMRAFMVIQNLMEIGDIIQSIPEDDIEDSNSCEFIKKFGFTVTFICDYSLEEVRNRLLQTPFLKDLQLDLVEQDKKENPINNSKEIILDESVKKSTDKNKIEKNSMPAKQSLINVSVAKIDKLMDLVGEIVVSEAMVIQNPELKGLHLESFHKAARQLQKITNELQDVVMSIRMFPLTMTFQKMNRIVRDMSHKLQKEVELELIGEQTEVDKNIIEYISDPLMHLIRNAIDHGIETKSERAEKGKSEKGKITLEAKSEGGYVWITIKDDGKGLDPENILVKARENRLINNNEKELTDKEIYSLIFLPGFSTKEQVTEFSGRGVGMDVVSKNIESIGGKIFIDSTLGSGTTVLIKIPLTLAIIDGMIIRVGNSRYIIPTISIKESFRVKQQDILMDTSENEMIMIRGECYPILRLHELYKVKTDVIDLHKGITIMVENDSKSTCIFADELLGEQQVVVKPLPKYIKKVRGIAGCTLLGDGGIGLILDILGLINRI
jgi:two-component system chemotaxis sensor kinase CheA